jgi:hypothetical protein
MITLGARERKRGTGEIEGEREGERERKEGKRYNKV